MDLYQYQLYQATGYLNQKASEETSNNADQDTLEEIVTIEKRPDLFAAVQIPPRPTGNKKHVVRKGCRQSRHHRNGIHCYFCRQNKYLL